MKVIIFILLVFLFNQSFAQDYHQEKVEINKVVQQFRQSIIQKDSATFYSLFHENPVVWIGFVKDRTQRKILEKDPSSTKRFFADDYKSFFQFILKDGKKEETFENVKIENDDVIASVQFDYSFWNENDMTNWGKEFWQLIKINGRWKITSVIYSYELTEYYQKPKRAGRIHKYES